MDERDELDNESKPFTSQEDCKDSDAVKGAINERDSIASREFEDKKKLRGRWSIFIIIWITCLTTFNCLVTVFVGFGSFHFEEYEWFITSVTMETFFEIIGMGYIAVHYLFSSGNNK